MTYSIKVYDLERKNPHTGYIETVVYTGDIRQKPKGWKVIKQRWANVSTDEFGLTGKHY